MSNQTKKESVRKGAFENLWCITKYQEVLDSTLLRHKESAIEKLTEISLKSIRLGDEFKYVVR